MPKINLVQRVAELRANAERLDALIGSKRAKNEDAEELERTQRLLRVIADQLDAGALDPFLLQVRTATQVETLLIHDTMPTPTSEMFRWLAAAGLDAASFPYVKAALLALDLPVACEEAAT